MTQFAKPETDEHMAIRSAEVLSQSASPHGEGSPGEIEGENETMMRREFKIRWDLRNHILKMSGQLPAC